MAEDKKPPVKKRISTEDFREAVREGMGAGKQVMPSTPHPREPPRPSDPPPRKK
jgi:hypothetical protein